MKYERIVCVSIAMGVMLSIMSSDDEHILIHEQPHTHEPNYPIGYNYNIAYAANTASSTSSVSWL